MDRRTSRQAEELTWYRIPVLAAQSVGRLAPSPTGSLHVGHARSFLLAWWHARSRGGRIVLRLEDLDTDRAKPGMVEQALEDLAWLGLDWDGEVLVQSQGAHRLDEAVQSLLTRGLAYPCVCTRAEIAASQSAPQEGVARELRYPGTCRDRFDSLADAERATGRSPAVRLRVEPGRIRVDDGFAGSCTFEVEQEVGDFPVARRAGAAAYQLAVVVDDAHAGVNEVVRGDDLLPSAARQILVQRALGLPHPRWFHVPLVVDEGGRRLAKRTDALALAELRAQGVDPRRIVAWIAQRSGLTVEGPVGAQECIDRFDLARVPKTPVVCPPDFA
jgi:glutamyl-tRNA synthetase